VRATQLELIERLSRAVELRDEETGGHVQRISRMAEELAVAVGLPAEEAEHIRDASALHDIGKIGVPDAILLKAGPLDAAERALMQRHTVVGSDLLGGSSSPTIQLAEEIARTHHERWDGAGYPNGLAGTDIPIAGRICAVVDVFDALTSKRPYKEAWTVDAALDELERQSGKHFDPALIEAFIALRGRGGSGTVHPFPTSAPEVAAA
jgi:response regulator RpfG family c-di-GMP phosphodiesterase